MVNIKKLNLALATAFLSAVLIFTGCGKKEDNYNKAMSLAKKGEYTESLSYFEKAIKDNSERADYYIDYGLALNHAGRYEEAIKMFDKATSDADNSVTRCYSKEAYYGKAMANYGLKNYEDAISSCDAALDYKVLEELDYDIYLTLAASHAMVGNEDAALDSYFTAIDLKPSSSEAYYERAVYYKALERYDEAAADYTSCLQFNSNCYDAYFGLYDLYTIQGNTDNAESILNELAGKKGESAELYCVRGRVKSALGDYDEARKMFLKAAEGGENEAYLYLGDLLIEQMDYEGAVDSYQKLIDNPGNVSRGIVYYKMAECMCLTKDYSNAIKYIDEGLKYADSSSYDTLLRNKVIILEKTGDYESALTEAEAYLAVFPSSESMAKEKLFIQSRIDSMELNKKLDISAEADHEMLHTFLAQ